MLRALRIHPMPRYLALSDPLPCLRSVGRIAGLLIVAVGLLAGCAKSPNADSSERPKLFHVIVQTDWFPQAEHGGFYQAWVKGYYREAGLDVEIAEGGPGETGLKLPRGLVQFGMSRGDDAIVKIARKIPIVIIGALMQHDPQALLLHRDDPVSSFADLNGRTIMTFPGDNWITYVERKYRIHFSVVPMNYGMAQFMADPRFIQQCYLTNEAYYVEHNGGHPKVIPLSESGFDPYRVILGNSTFVKNHPLVARAFVAATVRGWNDYMNGDPTEANREILRRNPQMSSDLIAYAMKSMRTYRLISGSPERGESTGHLSQSRIRDQIDTLDKLGVLDSHVRVDDVARLDLAP